MLMIPRRVHPLRSLPPKNKLQLHVAQAFIWLLKDHKRGQLNSSWIIERRGRFESIAEGVYYIL